MRSYVKIGISKTSVGMSGGLIALVSYGNENVVVNGNPQITWFYKAFVRYTHFSQEPVQIPMEGPTQLMLDAPILLKAKIPRSGDLLSDLVFRFTLPEIYSKAYIADGQLQRTPQEFAWIRQVGVRIIDRVTFTIGGTKVQEFTGDWIAARALLDQSQSEYQKWRVMVGDVPELFDPANGIYADPSGEYPNVVQWPTQSVQTNAPSIPGRVIRVPLGLWFSDSIANSLPLVSLQQHIPEIQIQLKSIRELYTILDPQGIRLRYGVQSQPYLETDQYTQIWKRSLYGDLPATLNNHYKDAQDPTGAPRYFYTDFNAGIPTSDGWPLNAVLEGLFTFVTDSERQLFATKSLQYPVRQAQNFLYPGVVGRNRYELDVHNIATRIIWFARRSDAIPYRNDYLNLTNWMFANRRPYVIPANGTGYPSIPGLGRSGLLLPGLQRRILRNAALIANGTNMFQELDAQFFHEYVPYKYLKGDTIPDENFGKNQQNEMWPLHVYSFALKGSDAGQPSGTLNTSRINHLDLDVDVEPIPVDARYTYTLSVFVETINFLEISNGLGGLKFAL
jgi:hypothetical protein